MQTAKSVPNRERVNISVPRSLIARSSVLAKQSGLSLSALVRQLLTSWIEKTEAEKLKREIVKECEEYYEIDKRIAAEWRSSEPRR